MRESHQRVMGCEALIGIEIRTPMSALCPEHLSPEHHFILQHLPPMLAAGGKKKKDTSSPIKPTVYEKAESAAILISNSDEPNPSFSTRLTAYPEAPLV